MAGTSYKGSEIRDVDQFIKDKAGLGSEREKEIGQHIGYRYDVNLLPDYSRLTPFLKGYLEYKLRPYCSYRPELLDAVLPDETVYLRDLLISET